MNEKSKDQQLKKLYDVLNAVLDYDIPKYAEMFKNSEYDYMENLNKIRTEVKMAYAKGQLPKLKKIQKDLVEPYKNDKEFPKYIKEKTGYNIMPFKELEKIVDEIIKRKRIATEDEYRDVMEMISELNVKNEPEKMNTLQKLIDEFERV